MRRSASATADVGQRDFMMRAQPSLAVLHVCPFSGLSGAARSMLTLIEEFSRRGIRQGLFLAREGEIGDMARGYGVVVRAAYPRDQQPGLKLTRGVGSGLAMRRMVAEFRPSLIHSCSAMGMRYAWAGALGRNLPVVCHQRDNYAADYFHLGLARADRVIAISEHVRALLPRRLRTRTDVIFNAVNVAAIPHLDQQRAPGPLRVGAAGRPTPLKGFDILLEAAGRLAEKHEFELHLWGPDPSATAGHAGELARAAASLAQRGVRVLQEPFRADIETFYPTVDIVVVPSRFPEPFGRMAIEAMAWGKPVIAAGHGGLVEIIKDGWNGLTYCPTDPGELSDKLAMTLRDQELRQSLASNAAVDVRTRFSAPAHADAVMAVYERLLSGARATQVDQPAFPPARDPGE